MTRMRSLRVRVTSAFASVFTSSTRGANGDISVSLPGRLPSQSLWEHCARRRRGAYAASTPAFRRPTGSIHSGKPARDRPPCAWLEESGHPCRCARPLTPSLPTLIWLCPVAMTVPGKSTIRRAGESAVLSLGVTAPRALISTRTSSVPRTTFTRCSSFRWLAACNAGVSAAEAISPSSISGRITLSSCFRISLLPNSRA